MSTLHIAFNLLLHKFSWIAGQVILTSQHEKWLKCVRITRFWVRAWDMAEMRESESPELDWRLARSQPSGRGAVYPIILSLIMIFVLTNSGSLAVSQSELPETLLVHGPGCIVKLLSGKQMAGSSPQLSFFLSSNCRYCPYGVWHFLFLPCFW